MIGGFLSETVGLIESALRLPSFFRKEDRLREKAHACARRLRIDVSDDQKVANLSLGHLRKIELARAIVSAPKMLLLDEVTSGLTEAEVAEVSELLRQIAREANETMSMVVVEHNVPFIFGLCDVVSAMDQGHLILTGKPHDVRRHPEVVRSYIGEESHVSSAAPSDNDTANVRLLRPSAPHETMLTVDGIDLSFGGTPVLRGVSLEVRKGEIVALLGRNGAGKSTLASAIIGASRYQTGSVRFQGNELRGLKTSAIVNRGLALVPQLGGVATRQTVRDNLEIAAFGSGQTKAAVAERLEELLELFPNLRNRMDIIAGGLSGGERKMLAIANVMVRRPQFVIFDEPSLGLSPMMVAQIQDVILKIKTSGISALVAEQNIAWLAPLADQAYLLDLGRVICQGSLQELSKSDLISNAYLGIDPNPLISVANAR